VKAATLLSACAAVLLLAHDARACSVCFGGAGSEMRSAFYWGFMILLLLPPAIVGLIAFLIYRSVRKRGREGPADAC